MRVSYLSISKSAVILSACLYLVSASNSQVSETVELIGGAWLGWSRLLRLPYGALRFYTSSRDERGSAWVPAGFIFQL